MTPFAADAAFESLRRVRTPRLTRWVARLLLLLFICSPVALARTPWQQTVSGRGQVVAFAPTERRQVVTTLISGRVKTWHVVEGAKVKAGDPIADIEDNDPDLASRLDEQRKFLLSRRAAATDEVAEQTRTAAAQEKALAAAVGAAKANRDAAALLVAVAEQTLKNNQFAATFERERFEMNDKLFKNELGLESRLNRDGAKAQSDRAATDVKRAEAEVKRAEAVVITNDSLILQAEANGLSAVATAHRDLHRAQQNVFSVERDLQEIDSRVERFKARFVKAPCDGIVHRVSANTGAGGQYVKEGDELVEIVPDTTDRVVELLIDGLDAPLVAAHMQQTGRGPHVRLQFEGWPAVQFTGWPSVAVGTFGGRIRQIDPTDDGKGRFRVLVEPEEMFDGDRWPEGIYLRQGNQAVGWVFLNRVTMGYELWRQFNGFPPVVAPQAPDKKDGGKPPKMKPGG